MYGILCASESLYSIGGEAIASLCPLLRLTQALVADKSVLGGDFVAEALGQVGQHFALIPGEVSNI